MSRSQITKVVIHNGVNIMNTLPRTMKINRMSSTRPGNPWTFKATAMADFLEEHYEEINR